MILNEKTRGFNDLAATVQDFSLKLLTEWYQNENCHLGNNGGEQLSKRESFFMARLDAYDNERLMLIKRETEMGYPYFIRIETNGEYFSNYEIGMMLDDLEENLPSQMIEDLEEEFYKIFNNSKED